MTDSEWKGPLSEMFGALPRATDAPRARGPVHPTALLVPSERERAFVMAVWEGATSMHAVSAGMHRLVAGCLLSELSRSPASLASEPRPLTALYVASYTQLPPDVLFPVGFDVAPLDASEHRDLLARVRNERERMGLPEPHGTPFIHRARIDVHGGATESAMALDDHLRRTVHEAWGEMPGVWLREAGRWARTQGGESPSPTYEHLERLANAVVSRPSEGIRFLPPRVFQTLCDAVGVVLAEQEGLAVQWGVCEPDDQGAHAPPLLRIDTKQGSVHLAVGLLVLETCVLPAQGAPTLAELVRAQASHLR